MAIAGSDIWRVVLVMYLATTAAAAAAVTRDDISPSGIIDYSRQANRRHQRHQRRDWNESRRTLAVNETLEQIAVETNVTSRGRPKHRLIRGSKNAVTITRKEYLRTDWCKTEPFQQIIHVEGCRRSRILNRFCYGQCNSFFIPKSDPEVERQPDDDDSTQLSSSSSSYGGSTSLHHFRSCAVCSPKTVDWATVVLRCPRLVPPFRRKRVRIVRQCKCLAVRLNDD